MKSSRRIATLAPIGVVLMLILVALPAGATPPEELDITATITFDIFGTMHGTGTWYAAEGLIVSSGAAEEDASHAGWPPGYIFKTAHNTLTWVDEYGSITIQSQVNVSEWIINAFNDVHFEGSGQWVVKSGDGAYESLKGQGTATFVGDITPDECSPPYFSPCNLIVVEHYLGSGHVHP